MKIKGFNKEELQKIEELLVYSNTINNYYEILYNLEVNSKQDSKEYQTLISLLKEAINIENKKYEKLNYEQSKKIFTLLTSSKELLKNTNTECIILQKYDDKIVRRIISSLSEKITIDNDFFRENIRLTTEEKENTSEEYIYNEIQKHNKITKAIRNDSLLVFLSILTEYINNKEYTTYKNDLIKLKYYISFIYKTIENQLLLEKFNTTNPIYLNSNITADLLGTNQKQYDLIKNRELETTINFQISDLLEIKDDEYKNKEKNIESITKQCFIRATLTLLEPEIVSDLYQKFEETIFSIEYLTTNTCNHISENAIICCFKSQQGDRSKVRTISFKPH